MSGCLKALTGKSILMRIDLHCHTEASGDCLTSIELFPERLREQQIQVQAITDHNEVWGAIKLRDMIQAATETAELPRPPLTIIVGEEVTSLEGEIIGLFLRKKIPAGLPAIEVVARIKEQGGLVLLPHGFDPLKNGRLRPAALAQIANDIDIVETFNARISFQRYNRRAAAWAAQHHVVTSAGTDAHRLADVGTAWAELPDQPIDGPEDLLKALAEGEIMGQWTHPVIAFAKKMFEQAKQRLS